MVLLAITLGVVTLLILNKIFYGGFFIFPWSHNNPYKVVLREIQVVRVALKKLGEEFDSNSITRDEYMERIDAIHVEMDRLAKVEIP